MVERRRCPATGAVHLVAVDDGGRAADPGRADHGARGLLHRRDRAEDPLGARDDARPGVRRRPRRPGRAPPTPTTAWSSSPSTTPRPASRPRPRGDPRGQLLALGEAGATIAIRQRRAPVQRRRVRVRTGAGLRVAHVRRGRRCGAAARACPRPGPVARERAPARRGRSRRRHAHHRRRRRARRRRNRYVDGGDGGDTYNYCPPATDTIVDTPESVSVTVEESGPVRARHRRHRAPTGCRPHAIGDERSCSRRSDDTVAVERAHHARAAHRRALPPRARGARPPRPRPPPARPLPAPRARRRFRRRVRVRGGAPRASPPRAGPTRSGSPRSCPAGSSTARTDGVGLALLHDGLLEYEVVGDGTRARAHAPARHRLPLACRARAAPQPRRSARPARGPAAPAATSRSTTPCSPTAATGVRRGSPTRPTSSCVPLERVRGGGVPGAASRTDRPGAAPSTAPRCRPCSAMPSAMHS